MVIRGFLKGCTYLGLRYMIVTISRGIILLTRTVAVMLLQSRDNPYPLTQFALYLKVKKLGVDFGLFAFKCDNSFKDNTFITCWAGDLCLFEAIREPIP